jgi:hypothetical protein
MRANAEGARPAAPSTDVLIPPARPVAPPPARTERPSGPVPEGPAPVVLRPKPAGSETDALPPRPTVPPARRIEPPSVPHADTSPPAPRSPRAEEAPLPQPLQKAPEPERAPQPPIRTASEARPAPDAPIEPPVMPAISPTLSVTSAGGETRIVLAWPEPVAAAVFRHGDRIWIVFPRREAFDVQKIGAQLGPGVDKLLRIEHAQATVLAAHVRPDVRARVAHQRNVWTIRLKRERGTPEAPEVKIALSRAIAEQAAVPLPGAEAPLRIVVPETSGKLHVVPSRASAAVAGNRTFVTFRIVAAAQGGVVEALADGLIVGAEGGAITIRRDAGLMLSNGSAQHGQ